MTNPVHLLSVASLLLAAFLVGAIVGTLARLVALRLGRKPVAPVAADAEAVPSPAPLVAAPVIAPLPVTPTPEAPPPAEVPVPDFAETLIALANESSPTASIEEARPSLEPAVAKETPVPAPAAAAMQPAHVAGETTSGVAVAPPLNEPPQSADAEKPETAVQHTAEVIRFPSATAEPAVEKAPADIIVGGEAVAVVDTPDLPAAAPEAELPVPDDKPAAVEVAPEPRPSGLAAHEDNFVFVGMPVAAKVTPVPAAEPKARTETIPIPVIAADAPVGASVGADLPVPEVVKAEPALTNAIEAPDVAVAGDLASPLEDAAAPVAAEPASEVAASEPGPVVAEPTAVAEQGLEPEAVAQPATPEEVAEQSPTASAEPEPSGPAVDEQPDEDAAMRAIEGNWSPGRAAPRRQLRPVPAPEGANQAVAASARAVVAARRTAEAVVAEVAEVKVEAGRPLGLDAPRDGRKDELTHIIGVLPVIETALNQLGIYHFDQMGALTDENIAWIEGHLGIPGRIGRELWREQARELSAVLKPRRAAES